MDRSKVLFEQVMENVHESVNEAYGYIEDVIYELQELDIDDSSYEYIDELLGKALRRLDQV